MQLVSLLTDYLECIIFEKLVSLSQKKRQENDGVHLCAPFFCTVELIRRNQYMSDEWIRRYKISIKQNYLNDKTSFLLKI